MKTRSTILLLGLLTVGAGGNLAAQPPEGSQLSPDENSCATCHGEADLWEGETARLYVPKEQLAEDVHWQKGVNCHDCHGGNPHSFDVPEAHSTKVGDEPSGMVPFRTPLSGVRKVCGHCHAEQRLALVKGVHAKAGARDERGRGLPLDCGKCHGEKAHGMLPVADSRSPVYLDHQVRTCGGCHPEHEQTYGKTVHGQGLYKSGLLVVAVCADCHGAHGIFYAADRRSTLHASNVATTCSKCHHSIQQRLQGSVHGRGGLGSATEKPAPDGAVSREPSCTDCHQGHHLLNPEEGPYRIQVANLCGNCHPDLSSRYAMSMHGKLNQLGFAPAAKCPDCHGAHDILAVADPRSRVARGTNRLKTCRQCHRYAVKNFSDYDPHANYKDTKNYAGLHSSYHQVRVVVFWLFGLFAIHAFLWYVRALVHTLRYGRHKMLATEQFALVRVAMIHRVFYVSLVISFLGLMLTGMPIKFSDQDWARSLVGIFGGFESTRFWHHFFAVTMLGTCAAHLAWGAARIVKLRLGHVPWKTILFGPDSPVPAPRDFRDLVRMIRWFAGLGRKPKFECWTYWEKLDYWAVWLAVCLVGGSGLLLWYPNLFCLILPGRFLNLAKVIHSGLAILAAGLVFLIHSFHTHFRPEKFPLDPSVLTGLVSEEHLREYRPAYVERLERTGRLNDLRRVAPSGKRLRLVVLAGFVVLSLGLLLLVIVLLASLGE